VSAYVPGASELAVVTLSVEEPLPPVTAAGVNDQAA
jgi:hypothetical protein